MRFSEERRFAMGLFKRNPVLPARYGLVLIAILLCGTGSLVAQQAEPAVEARAFNCGFLYGLSLPRVYILDPGGEYVPLKIDSTRLQSWQRIPAGDSVTFYRKTRDPDGEMVMRPQATYPLPPGSAPVRLLFYYDRSGEVRNRVLVDDPREHGPLQVRAVNLTASEVGVNFGPDSLILGEGEDAVFTPVNATDIDFNFRFGTATDETKPYVSPKRVLRFPRPQMRLTVIFAYRPRVAEEGDGFTFDLEAMRFYDFGQIPE